MARATRTLARGPKRRRPGRRAPEPPARRPPRAGAPRVVSEPRPEERERAAERVAAAEVGPFEPELGRELTEEERIESAKYLPRHLPKRLFEEERFLFPETYRVNRVRLLVKDPEWIFAYWDVDPRSVDSLRNEVGERALALTRLTLRVREAKNGGMATILLPYGARAWYVRADGAPRSYRAQLGWTLPSGEFRPLAESNVVVTPRSGPSAVTAPRRARPGAPLEELAAAAGAPVESPAPWGETPSESAAGPAAKGGRKKRPKGGASDVFRR